MARPLGCRSVARAGFILAALGACGCGGGVIGVEQSAAEPESRSESVLPGPWLGSFEAGLDADEQLWLLPMSGDPVSVLPPNDDPYRFAARSSFGYSDEIGYVSQASFDAARARLTVSSLQASGSRLRWLDLKTGIWNSLGPAARESRLFDSEYGTTILSSDGTIATILAAGDKGFEPVGELTLEGPDSLLSHLSSMRVQRFFLDGVQHLLIAGDGTALAQLGHFEHGARGWQPAAPLLPGGGNVIWVSVSSEGTPLCAIAADQSSWLLSRDGALQLDAPLPAGRCGFSSVADRVWFSGFYYTSQVWVADHAGTRLTEIDNFVPQANAGHFAYGTRDGRLQRLDWNTLELQPLTTPAWCRSEAGVDTGVSHRVQIVGSVALVENSCRCGDCHFSGVYLLPLAEGASAQPLVEPTEWQILQIARLADGSAAIAQHWLQPVLNQVGIPSGGDRFLRVAPDGDVSELGPFPGMLQPLHGPVGAL
jgi:hypothetical protein